MEEHMSNILYDLILEGKLDLYLNEKEKENLIKLVKNINKSFLYESDFHGLHHSEKVLLCAYLLGRHEDLNPEEMEILADAALYHDIGRSNENEDEVHGYSATLRIEKAVGDKEIYRNPENLEILKAICDAHSVKDSRMQMVLENYEIDESKKESLLKLANLLKDADALDRTRFQKTSVAALQTHFLRFDYSRELVRLAYNVNDYYRNQICERNFNKYSNIKNEPSLCLHGIGFNFSSLDGILDYGILSEYAKKKKNIVTCRNFKGNNGEMWISVCQGDGEAKKQFVDNGIYFECVSSNLIKGQKIKSEARSKGLPVDSGRYSDERFAFYEIPLENVYSIGINKELLNKDISTLNYLNGSDNYETLVNNINVYLNYLRMKLDYFPEISKIEEIKIKFRDAVTYYEGLPIEEQKLKQQDFFAKIDKYKEEINREIQAMLKQAFKEKLNKNDINVFDVMTYILNSKNIDYQYNDGKFNLNVKDKIFK